MSTPIPSGNEFVVNSTTAGFQFQPVIQSFSDGHFLVAWTTSGNILLQSFNADGSKRGAEVVVATSSEIGSVETPDIAELADGGFVVTWSRNFSFDGDPAASDIFARIFHADGTPAGAAFDANLTQSGGQLQPSVITLADGRFAIVWEEGASIAMIDTSALDVRGQLFNANGSTSGAELAVAAGAEGQAEPSIAALPDGQWVSVWRDDSGSFTNNIGNSAIVGQILAANGSPSGAPFLVNTTGQGSQRQPFVTTLSDGRFVVAWTDGSLTDGDTSGTALRAQVFNPDGSKSGTELLVNTTTASHQVDSSITALHDGRFVVVWTDQSPGFNSVSVSDIRAQVFNPDGSKSGTEYLVNATTGRAQNEPTVTTLADGRFVVAWTDDSRTGGDTSGTAIRAQIFDPRLAGVPLFGSDASDDWVGSRFNDLMLGEGGNDTMTGGMGKDTLDGGAGLDTANYAEKTAGVVVTLNGAALMAVRVGGVVEDSIRNIENIVGGAGNDTLVGDAQNNVFRGGAGIDGINGSGGIDTVDYADKVAAVVVTLNGATAVTVKVGGVGEDRIAAIANLIGGSAGDTFIGDGQNNTFRGGAGIDAMNGGSGLDTADYSDKAAAVVTSLNGATAVTVFVGGVGEDRIASIENLVGGSAGDTLTGDALTNRIDGGSGNDTLNGALGFDTLTGGLGSDRFVFSTALGAGNIDTITDFQAGVDKIVLDDDIFNALGIVGTVPGVALTASKFQLGGAANDAGDRIIYNQATGQLFYDTDGNGVAVQQQIALIGVSAHAALTAGDFLVVA